MSKCPSCGTDVSALLAQARAEQKERDAPIAEDDGNPHRSIDIAAAIRGQK